MDKFIINGGKKLYGEISISGAKNAAVAIIPAVILADEPCTLENVPSINDVAIDLRILRELGVEGQRRLACVNQTVARLGVSYILQLRLGDLEQVAEVRPVKLRQGKHHDE